MMRRQLAAVLWWLAWSTNGRYEPLAKECAEGRKVYIDLGAGWANTLRLWREIGGRVCAKDASRWEIYAFEAHPLLQPFDESLVNWLNSDPLEDLEMPRCSLPRTDNPVELRHYATRYGCGRFRSKGGKAGLTRCMSSSLLHELLKLSPDRALNSTALVRRRLNEAATPNSGERPRYTFIPAASGLQSTWIWMDTSRTRLLK